MRHSFLVSSIPRDTATAISILACVSCFANIFKGFLYVRSLLGSWLLKTRGSTQFCISFVNATLGDQPKVQGWWTIQHEMGAHYLLFTDYKKVAWAPEDIQRGKRQLGILLSETYFRELQKDPIRNAPPVFLCFTWTVKAGMWKNQANCGFLDGSSLLFCSECLPGLHYDFLPCWKTT